MEKFGINVREANPGDAADTDADSQQNDENPKMSQQLVAAREAPTKAKRRDVHLAIHGRSGGTELVWLQTACDMIWC